MPHIDPATLPKPADFRHHVDLQLRFNDIDILGHLNNTVYFSFYDTGKAYYLEAVNGGRMDFRRVESVIANVDCAFVSPTYFGEEIEVCTKCEHVGDKSLTIFQMIVNKKTQEVKSVARTIMVAFDPDKMVSTTVPDHWRQGIAAYEQGLENPSATLIKERI